MQRNLLRWAKSAFRADVHRASDKVRKNVQGNIRQGKDGAGNSMVNIKPQTLDMPIRFATDKTKRREVRSSRKPLVARGNAVNSIKMKKGKDRDIIEPSTKHGRTVFRYNALSAPTKRDALVVGDNHEKIIEDEILKGLDKALRF